MHLYVIASALLVVLASCDRVGEAEERMSPKRADADGLRAAEGPMNPKRAEADAMRAADGGRFGLIYTGSLGYVGPSKVLCNAPLREGPGVNRLKAGIYYVSDVPFEDDPEVLRANSEYAFRYNATILDHPKLPYPDVCRLVQPNETWGTVRPRSAWSEPAQEVSGTSRNLHDAARRGSLPELRDWISRTGDVDALDEFGLSALSWAVVRNRPDHVEVLMNAGALPFPGDPVWKQRTPLWLAACFGRDSLVAAMVLEAAPSPALNVPDNCTDVAA